MKLKKISSWKNFESIESKILNNEIRSWLLEKGPITKRIKKMEHSDFILLKTNYHLLNKKIKTLLTVHLMQ